MAASRSFLACLQGLQRLGSFFKPLSWKKTCSPTVHVNCSLQSTHLIDRSANSDASPFVAPCNSMSGTQFTSPLVCVEGMSESCLRL